MKSKILLIFFLVAITSVFAGANESEELNIENDFAGCVTNLSNLRCNLGYVPARLSNKCLVCVKLVKRSPKHPPQCGYGTDDADCNSCPDWENNCPHARKLN